MTNLDSILKSRDIALPTKFRLIKALFFPVVTYVCESTRPGLPRGPLRGKKELRPPWKHPSVRTSTRPSSTSCQAPQALGLRGRGRKGPPSPPSHVQVSLPGMWGHGARGKGGRVGGWVGAVLCGKRREYRRDVYGQPWGQTRVLDLWEAGPRPKRGHPP